MVWLALLCGIAAVILLGAGFFVHPDPDDSESLGKKKLSLKWGAGLLATAIVFLAFAVITFIQPGQVGVKVLFGKIQSGIFVEGPYLKNPFLSVKKMTVRTQSYTMSKVSDEGKVKGRSDAISALTKDNLPVDMDITVLYKLIPSSAPDIYRILGNTDVYTDKVVRPAVRTAIRNATARFTASEVMSERRLDVEKDIQKELEGMLNGYFAKRKMSPAIICERVLLRNVEPPQKLRDAIQTKLAAEQDAQKMQYVLQKEKMEAERKRVEAKGIADAQKIIARSLNQSYLQWYYIETLKKLVNSPNNSTIILPFDQKLTPLLPISSLK